MSKRKKHDQRCTTCLMRNELCLCDEIPKLDLATRLVVIGFKRELKSPSNTGRLACLALTNSALLTRGDPDQPYDLQDHIPPDTHSILLFPSEDALQLSPDLVANMPRPITLVVPDGNWRQASKMSRRDPVMAAMPRFILPVSGPSHYEIRCERRPGGLATIEAIARALGLIEGPEVQDALESLLSKKVSRTLASRGTVPS